MNPNGLSGKFGAGGIWAEDPVKFARVNSIFLNELAAIDSRLSFPLPRSEHVGSVSGGRVNEPSDSARRFDCQVDVHERAPVEVVVEPVVDRFVDPIGGVGDDAGVGGFERFMGSCAGEVSYVAAKLLPGKRVDDASVIVGAQPTHISYDIECGAEFEEDTYESACGLSFSEVSDQGAGRDEFEHHASVVDLGLDELGPGYDYLWLIRGGRHKEAVDDLGVSPRLIDVLTLPAEWFIDSNLLVRVAVAYRPGRIKLGGTLGAYNAYTCLSSLFCIADRLPVVAGLASGLRFSDPVELNAIVDNGVVFDGCLSRTSLASITDEPGACYLKAIRSEFKPFVYSRFRRFPALDSLRLLPAAVLLSSSDMRALHVVQNGDNLHLTDERESRERLGSALELFESCVIDVRPGQLIGAAAVSPQAYGYEYLSLVKPAAWAEVAALVGKGPTLQRMLDFPQEYCVEGLNLRECGVAASWRGNLGAGYGCVPGEMFHFALISGPLSFMNGGFSLAELCFEFKTKVKFRPWVLNQAASAGARADSLRRLFDGPSARLSSGELSYLLMIKPQFWHVAHSQFGFAPTWRQLLYGLQADHVDCVRMLRLAPGSLWDAGEHLHVIHDMGRDVIDGLDCTWRGIADVAGFRPPWVLSKTPSYGGDLPGLDTSLGLVP